MLQTLHRAMYNFIIFRWNVSESKSLYNYKDQT